MIGDIIKKIRNELATLPDFKGVYIDEPVAVTEEGYPICWIAGGYGRRGFETLRERPYIALGKVFDEIYNFTIEIEMIYEETESNALLIYTLMDKVRDKLRNNMLGGLIYNIVLEETGYPYKKGQDTLLRASQVYLECTAKRTI